MQFHLSLNQKIRRFFTALFCKLARIDTTITVVANGREYDINNLIALIEEHSTGDDGGLLQELRDIRSQFR